jgi:hypothetical protein
LKQHGYRLGRWLARAALYQEHKSIMQAHSRKGFAAAEKTFVLRWRPEAAAECV